MLTTVLGVLIANLITVLGIAVVVAIAWNLLRMRIDQFVETFQHVSN